MSKKIIIFLLSLLVLVACSNPMLDVSDIEQAESKIKNTENPSMDVDVHACKESCYHKGSGVVTTPSNLTAVKSAAVSEIQSLENDSHQWETGHVSKEKCDEHSFCKIHVITQTCGHCGGIKILREHKRSLFPFWN